MPCIKWEQFHLYIFFEIHWDLVIIRIKTIGKCAWKPVPFKGELNFWGLQKHWGRGHSWWWWWWGWCQFWFLRFAKALQLTKPQSKASAQQQSSSAPTRGSSTSILLQYPIQPIQRAETGAQPLKTVTNATRHHQFTFNQSIIAKALVPSSPVKQIAHPINVKIWQQYLDHWHDCQDCWIVTFFNLLG